MTNKKIIPLEQLSDEELGTQVNYITGNCDLAEQKRKGLLRTLKKLEL